MQRNLVGQRTFVGFVAAVTMVAVFLHFWRIGSAPAVFYVDECSIAYNAYSISRTGADEYGTMHPLFFRSVSHQDPVLIYCLVPLVERFGLQKWVTRLPSGVFHILACVAFGFLVQEYCRNKWISLFGAFVFSLIPWSFAMSRTIGAGYSPMLFGMVLGWLFSLLAIRKRSSGCAAVAGVAYAFATYAYSAGLLLSALLLFCFGLAFNRLLLSRLRQTVVLLIAYLVALLPMAASVIHTPQLFFARFQQVSLFQNHPSLATVLGNITTRYLDYFSPRFLFLTGDHELRQHTGFRGELFLFTIPLILSGAYWVIRFRTQPYYRFLALNCLVYPAAAVLTMDRMHSGRSINGVIPWLLIAAVGARALWQHRRLGRKLVVIACAAGLVESGLYLADYFGPYQARYESSFPTSFIRAAEYCFSQIGSNQTIYVSGSVGAPFGVIIDKDLKPLLYAYFLFYGRIDPLSYQREGFSNAVVQPYLGHVNRPGLLLRYNYRLRPGDGTQLLGVPNVEAVPDRARLQATFQDDPPREYQVFEIR